MSKFLSKFSIQSRLLLLPIPLIVSLLIILLILVRSLNGTIEFAEKEDLGIQTIKPIYFAYGEGLKRFKIGNESTKDLLPLLESAKPEIERTELLDLDTKELTTWNQYSEFSSFDKSRSISFLNDTQELALKVGDFSNLILDPEVNSYYQMEITLFRVPEILKNIGVLNEIIRDEYLETNKSSNQYSSISYTKALISINFIESTCKEIQKSYKKSIEDDSPYVEELKTISQEAKTSCDHFVQDLKKTFIQSSSKPKNYDELFSILESGTKLIMKIQENSILILEKQIDRICNFSNFI